MQDAPIASSPRLTSLAHGGGCGCKLAPGVLAEILAETPAAKGIAKGNLSRRTGISQSNEIGIAAGSFDAMQEVLGQLQSLNVKMDTLLDTLRNILNA